MRCPLAERSRHTVWRRFSPLFGPAAVQVIRLRGPAKFSVDSISAVYAGNGRNLTFLQQLFFAQAEREPLARYSTPWRLDSRLRPLTGDAELCLTELPPLWAAVSSTPATLRVPAWVRQTIELPASADSRVRLFPRGVEREVARHVRRRGYRIDFTTDTADVRRFFRKLYRPYVQSRFGSQAVIVTEQAFLARCRGQRLARLFADGDWVAGMVLLRQGERLRLGWFGAATDPPPSGASEVLDVLAIRHAHGEGARQVILGNSRPCLADGVLRYKSRLGGRVAMPTFPQTTLNISIRRPLTAVRECLERQPLLAPVGKSALGAYRVTEGDDIRLERLDADV